MYDIYGRNGEKIMLLDELKIEQDDLKVGDVVYTSHHPNIGVWVSFQIQNAKRSDSTDHSETNKNCNGLWRIYES